MNVKNSSGKNLYEDDYVIVEDIGRFVIRNVGDRKYGDCSGVEIGKAVDVFGRLLVKQLSFGG